LSGGESGTPDAWSALSAHRDAIADIDLRGMFDADPDRVSALTTDAAGIHFDHSRHRITSETIGLLAALARERRVETLRDAMFRGERINRTEDRPVLHVALRMPPERSLVVDGTDVVREVHHVLDRMSVFADEVRSGARTGHTGLPFEAVVNIGIGGSALGPEMAWRALRHFSDDRIEFRFVSNVDGSDLEEAVAGLDPERTLFIVCSKTFTTLETMTNARAARAWSLAGLGGDPDAVASHFVAVSTNLEAVADFGIDPNETFGFWDWVGGRYSMDSAIGLSTMLAIGPENFRAMLAGFHAVDEHFLSETITENVPMLHGLIAVWNRNFLGMGSSAVIPYAEDLSRFPAYLQQLTMESNGKRVEQDGTPVECETGAVWWGEPGTDAQHSFFQLLHQGTDPIPLDLIVFERPGSEIDEVRGQHRLLVANALAQGRALAFGRTAEETREAGVEEDLVAHRTFPGNRPSATLMLDRLTPTSLGSLVALYEHSVFTQGAIWGIDSFDQWGVELGKEMAGELVPYLSGEAEGGLDASTEALIRRYRKAEAAGD
jgi:glucose-6-phosphate isomerase